MRAIKQFTDSTHVQQQLMLQVDNIVHMTFLTSGGGRNVRGGGVVADQTHFVNVPL